jgi:hypothetical protein
MGKMVPQKMIAIWKNDPTENDCGLGKMISHTRIASWGILSPEKDYVVAKMVSRKMITSWSHRKSNTACGKSYLQTLKRANTLLSNPSSADNLQQQSSQ